MPGDSSAPMVHFGADRYVEALVQRLERYFESQRQQGQADERAGDGPSRGDQALVVGIYGPWGCGKTTWLRRIESKFRERNPAPEARRITVPVFFNAWQFEREPHLVVPLLKTAELSVRQFLDEHEPKGSSSRAAGVWRWARESMLMLGDAAQALASGLSGDLSFGGFGPATGAKVSMNAGKAIDTFVARRKERQQAKRPPPSPLEAFESLYFDMRGYMRALTGRGDRPEAWRWIEQAQYSIARQKHERQREVLRQELVHRREAVGREIDELSGWSLKHGRLTKKYRELEEALKKLDDPEEPATKALTDGTTQATPDEPQGANVDHRLDLLFLIDDLDRCMPEKAVEVLESIKLFLEVPGCAFVLGVDDEVIERGILHRYRDYASGPSARRTPISGAEYLEKMVHLPVRVPPLAGEETRAFLQREYPKLFQASAPTGSRRPDRALELEGQARAEAMQEPEPEWNEDLLELFERCVPGVPRKLIRAAELLSLLDEVARALDGQRCFGSAPYEPTLLARLVLLQLFAPEVYRLGARPEGYGFLDGLKGLAGVGLDPEIERLRRQLEKDGVDDGEETRLSGDVLVEWKKKEQRLRLAVAVQEVLEQRTRFDARNVVDGEEDYDWSRRVAPHYRLVEERALQPATPLLPMTPMPMPPGMPMPGTPAARNRRPSGRPTDLPAFVAFALAADRKDRNQALAQAAEQLRGRVFDEATLTALLEEVRAGGMQARVTAEWMRTFERHLEPESMTRLIRETGLLQRSSGAEALDAIDLVCRTANPPERPGIVLVRMREMLPDGATLDLRPFSLRGRYLVGLDGEGATWPADAEAWRGADTRGGRLTSTMEPAHPPQALALDLGTGPVWGVCAVGDDRLASAGDDGTVRVWRASDGSLLHTLEGHRGTVRGVCAVGDDRLASAGSDGTVRVWRASDGSLLHTLEGHRGTVRGVCAVGDDRLASAGSDGTVRVWRASDGSLLHTLEGHRGPVWGVCAVGDDRLASAGSDGTVRVWRASDGSLLHTLEGHRGTVWGVCAVGDDRLASAGSDGTVRVWRASDGSLLHTLEGHRGTVRGVCAVGDDRLASAGDDGTVRVWRASDGSLLHTLESHRSWVWGVCAVGDDRLASAGSDGTVRVWRASDGSLLHTLEGHRGTVWGVCAVGDDHLASAGDDGTVRVWRASDGSLLHTLESHRSWVWGVCAVGDDRLASAGSDGTVRVWRASDGSLLHTLEGHRGTVWGVCAVGDDHLASAGNDGTVRVWRASDGSLLHTLEGHRDWVRGVCAVGDDRLASAGDDGTVRVWRASDGSLLHTLEGHRDWVRGVCAVGDDCLASAGSDGTVRVWRASDGSLLHTLEGHRGPVLGVCAVGDDRLASAGSDGTVRVWRASDGSLLHTLEGHRDWVRGVCAVGDDRLASAGDDGTVRVWRASDGSLLLRIQPKPGTIALVLDPRETAWPIVLSRSDRPWQVEPHQGLPLPADPELHRLVAFITTHGASTSHPDASIRVPIHAIPRAFGEQWSWSEDGRAIRFKWPLDPAARRALRHYVFGRSHAE